jgi:hypothetical protein
VRIAKEPAPEAPRSDSPAAVAAQKALKVCDMVQPGDALYKELVRKIEELQSRQPATRLVN